MLVLAQIAHWLQQRPCLELQGPLQEGSDESCIWHLATDTLADVMAQLDLDTGNDPHACSFVTQLEASGKFHSKEGLEVRTGNQSRVSDATKIREVLEAT